MFMNISHGWLGAFVVIAGVLPAPMHRNALPLRPVAPPACSTDSNYQRLAFWIGDWDVVDTTGAHYATQRVRAVIDACAITAEWTGRVGDKGMNLSSFDGATGEWRQMYASNQVPGPLGVQLRRSDPSYGGAGVRFIPLVDPAASELSRSRVTIMPLSDNRAMQLFEDSKDGGRTWQVVFRAEHRRVGAPSR
jgi:hypothetical protein